MARRSMKGGFGDDGAMFSVFLIFIAIAGIVLFIISITSKKEKFTPVAPSPTGDNREVTPSGNVILY